MSELIKETVTTEDGSQKVGVSSTKRTASSYQTVEYLIYFIFGIFEILLAFRVVLRLAGASVSSGFVSGIYNMTNGLIAPFQGIFQRSYTNGLENTSIFEPSVFIAIIVYMVLAWGIVQLVKILSGEVQTPE